MKRLEGMLISSKDVQSGQRLFFFPLCCFCGSLVEFFSRKSAPDEVSEPAVRSERVSLFWHLMGDLFQWGPQTVDLRVPLCRIMQGQRVRSHAGLLSLLVKKTAFISRPAFKINSLLQNISLFSFFS